MVVALAISFALVLLVMYAFLGNWRATLIPAVTIPISILAACAAMSALGFTLNVLTLLGMVLAIGLVVDDAIVVLENIYRRIEHGQPSLLAAIDGSREIGFAVIATTLVLSAVFVPISFLGGRVGRLFSEFGFTLAASILFSCLVALSLTPMMTSQLFRGGATRSRVSDHVAELFQRLSRWYEGVLRRSLRHCWGVVIGAVIAFAAARAADDDVPEREHAERRPRRRAYRAQRAGRLLAAVHGWLRAPARRHPRNRRWSSTATSSASTFACPVAVAAGTGEVNRAQAVRRAERLGRSRANGRRSRHFTCARKVADLPGVRASVVTPTAFNWGGADPFKAVLEGPDYETLSAWSKKVIALAQENPGLLNVDTDYKERKPQIKVSIDRARAAELGVSLETIGRTLETMLGSRIVTTFVKSGREYYVILQGAWRTAHRPPISTISMCARSGGTS